MTYQSMQQNLNQIAQICNQLSQSERNAAQQLQQCAQLCNQVSQQMQQFSGTTGQFTGMPAGVGTGTYQGNWSNIPINTSQFGPSGQQAYTGQFGGSAKFEVSREPGAGSQATGQAVFNTNKDLGQ
jgi:uncharacterized protein with von Willebrand factor type A (vWA) domain